MLYEVNSLKRLQQPKWPAGRGVNDIYGDSDTSGVFQTCLSGACRLSQGGWISHLSTMPLVGRVSMGGLTLNSVDYLMIGWWVNQWHPIVLYVCANVQRKIGNKNLARHFLTWYQHEQSNQSAVETTSAFFNANFTFTSRLSLKPRGRKDAGLEDLDTRGQVSELSGLPAVAMEIKGLFSKEGNVCWVRPHSKGPENFTWRWCVFGGCMWYCSCWRHHMCQTETGLESVLPGVQSSPSDVVGRSSGKKWPTVVQTLRGKVISMPWLLTGVLISS